MTITKLPKRWANAGTITAPSSAKQDLGWIGNEQVPFEWWNWLQDRVESLLNTAVDERINSFYSNAAAPTDMIATGLWDESWAVTNDAENVISGGATKEYVHMAVYFNSDNEPRLLVLDNAFTTVEIWDPRTLTLLDTSPDLAVDLPTGSGQTWQCEQICTDNETVYGVFRNTGAGTDTQQVQAFDIGGSWGVKSGWAATGTALPGTDAASIATGTREAEIIVADSSNLAVANGRRTIVTSASEIINILSMADGSISSSGSGDAPAGLNAAHVPSKICSDGTNIYFFARDTSPSNGYICTATIANATAGSGGAGYPETLAAETIMYFCSCGTNMIASVKRGDGTAAAEVIRSHSAANSNLDHLLMGQDSQAVPIVGTKYIFNDIRDICFDGINIWVYCTIFHTGGTETNCLLRIDAAKMHLQTAGYDRLLQNATSGPFFISPEVGEAATNLFKLTCVFDGRDMWCITDANASQTNSGKIFRLPLALLRS